MANVKRIVAHPKLYLRVEGKLQHIPKGTEVTVTKDQCEKLGARLMDPAEAKKLKGGKLTKGDESESEAVKELTAELEGVRKEAADAVKETGKATKALTATAAKLDTAQKEIKALKAAAKK